MIKHRAQDKNERGLSVMEKLKLDFYYGREAEQFTFYRLPKALITDACFKGMTNNAKLLYGLMLDRMSRSKKRGWLDEANKVFIKYSLNNIEEDLNVSRKTASSLLKELEEIGLIDMIQQPGVANIIYVKNFVSEREQEDHNLRESEDKCNEETSVKSKPVEKIHQCKNSTGEKTTPVEKSNQCSFEQGTSGKNTLVPVEKLHPSNIEIDNNINNNLLATTQAIYKSWFVDFEPFDNVCPSDWGNGCVDDIAEFYDSMRKPLSSLERADMERIYPYYGAVSIVDYVDDFIFDGEYLLLSEDGIYVVDENGHPLLQHITGKFWANNHAHILKGKSGFNEDSLYLFLANTNMAPIVTGAAQPKINQANLKSFPITIPTSEVIENFNALIQPFFDQRLSNEAEVKKLESLKDLLLSRLVN